MNDPSMTPQPRLSGVFLALAFISTTLLAFAQSDSRLTQRLGRNAPNVRRAFRVATTDAQGSTVTIYCNGTQRALGTIVRSDGLIITKASELEGDVKVRLPAGGRIEANKIAEDEESDLALIKVDVDGLPTVQWSVGQRLALGQFAITPGTRGDPLAVGVVGVLPREIPPRRGLLGVELELLVRRNNRGESDPRAVIANVRSGSVASSLGLRPGDAFLEVNGEDVGSPQDVIRVLSGDRPGRSVQFKIDRRGEVLSYETRLGTLPEEEDERIPVNGSRSLVRTGFPLAFQHDSTLLPRECGGPVVGLDGRAIGINIAREGRTTTYAIPASKVVEIIAKLRNSDV